MGKSVPKKGITPMQRAFAEGCAAGKSRTQAARDAGYAQPDHQADSLWKNKNVQAEYKRLKAAVDKAREESTVADALELQSFLTSIVRGKVKDFDLTLSGDVEETPPKLETRRKAAVDLGKMIGATGDGSTTVNVTVPTMTREEAIRGIVEEARSDKSLRMTLLAALKEMG